MTIQAAKLKIDLLYSLELTLILIFLYVIFFNYASAADNSKQVVNVASARKASLIEPIFRIFSKQTGITVQYTTASAEKLRKGIKSQGKNTSIDLFLAVDGSDLYEAQQIGILQPVRSKILLKNIPRHLRDPANHWFGLSLRVRSVVYHRYRVDKRKLDNFSGLGDNTWHKRLVLRTSEKIYNKSLVAMLIATYGENEAERIVRSWINNLAMAPLPKDTSVIQAIAMGSADIGIVNSYYLAKMLKQYPDLPIDMAWVGDKTGGVHVNITGAGITRYAKNKNNAIRLLEWLSSPTAQKLFADMNIEYPVNKSVAPHEILKQWGEYKHSKINVKKMGELREQAIALMHRVGYE